MHGKEIIKKLKQSGWQIDRVKGSHHILMKGGKICPVPVHGKRDVSIGTVKSIEKITGEKLLP